MVEKVPFRLKLTGGTADQHQFQGYDGYMALAGFAWTLALVANYSETGKIRLRGDFPGRAAVRASAPTRGSIIADFTVFLQQNPALVFGVGGASLLGATASSFLYDLLGRVIARNLGKDTSPQTPLLSQLITRRGGEIEALVARVEPAVRQTHGVIGNGVAQMEILGGFNIINTYDEDTREYVRQSINDPVVRDGLFSVSAFNVNSGHGSVFDRELGRVIPISMSKEVLIRSGSVFTWGLDQYANKKKGNIEMKFTRVLAMDDTPKRYIVLSAAKLAARIG